MRYTLRRAINKQFLTAKSIKIVFSIYFFFCFCLKASTQPKKSDFVLEYENLNVEKSVKFCSEILFFILNRDFLFH